MATPPRIFFVSYIRTDKGVLFVGVVSVTDVICCSRLNSWKASTKRRVERVPEKGWLLLL